MAKANAADGAEKVWDLNELIIKLDSFKTLRETNKFAKDQGKFVGSGIHRDTYVVKTTKFLVVVKLARHDEAVSSNKSEIAVSHLYRKSPVLAKIYAHSAKGFWIIAEFVPENTHMGKIAAFFNVKIDKGSEELQCSDFRLSRHITGVASTKEHPWCKEYANLIAKEGVHDLHEGNWRMRTTGEPVIVDYGFSRHNGR